MKDKTDQYIDDFFKKQKEGGYGDNRMSDKEFLVPPRQGKTIKRACDKMTEIIESCWDENNPEDGLSFDERLHKKMDELPHEDKDLLDKVLRFE